jgi:hypothetical protein
MKNSMRMTTAAIVMAALLSACGDDAPSDTTPTHTTAAPTPTPTATLPGAATTEVSETSDSFGQLTGVRVGEHPGFDRVVFEFAKDVPGYTVKYVELPVLEDGSGEPVDLPDADTAVKIVFTPASGFDMDAGEATYTGPKTVTNDKTVEITGVVSSGDFESLLSWAVGLHDEVPFKVTKLDSPARLVVDFQTG